MLLELDKISVSYGNRQVLKQVSLNVKPGEILAVLGHNGAGKTSLLKSIMSLVPVTEGKVTMDGSIITNTNPRTVSEAGIRMLPAEFRGVFASRPVRENLKVAAPASLYKDKQALNRTIEYCLDMFPALREKFNQPAGSLSGGQQQMVAMSVALMGRPKLMLLDEPSIGLSPNLVQKILEEVRRLADSSGLAAIIVEQNAKVALQVADRVAALRTGEIIHESATSEISMDDLWNLF